MENIPTKNTGDTYSATEFNGNQSERKNAVTDSGQSLGGDLFQLSRANAINASGADYYDDSGVANAYVLSKPVSSSLRSPPAYFDGMRIRFRPSNANTGASTVNVTGIGVVSILKEDGASALSPNDLVTGRDAQCRYSLSAVAFLLQPKTADEATGTSKGTVFSGNQPITIANNSVDPANDIDFSGGKIIFDDGSGEITASPITKQADGTWVQGNNQGGLDTGTPTADTWYYCYAIYNPTTGTSDALFTKTFGSPVLPSGYTKKSYRGAIYANGSTLDGFTQIGKRFIWDAAALDYTGTTTAGTYPLTVPDQISTLALTIHKIVNAASWWSAYQLGTTPTESNFGGSFSSGNWAERNHTYVPVITDTSGQIGIVAISGAQAGTHDLTTLGWVDSNIED